MLTITSFKTVFYLVSRFILKLFGNSTKASLSLIEYHSALIQSYKYTLNIAENKIQENDNSI